VKTFQINFVEIRWYVFVLCTSILYNKPFLENYKVI